MNKIIMNIKYKLGFLLPWVGWDLLGYIITMFFVFYGLIQFSVITEYDGSLVYRLACLSLVLFGLSFIFREEFDLMLSFSHTREEIFLSITASHFIMSFLFASIVMAEKSLIDLLNRSLHFTHFTDAFHFFPPYATGNVLLAFCFFLALSFALSMLGFFIGSLFYRLGKIFTIFFWFITSAIPLFFLLVFFQSKTLVHNLEALGSILTGFDVGAGALWLLLSALIAATLAYANIRKLPQK